jgi:phage FluMu protein Com
MGYASGIFICDNSNCEQYGKSIVIDGTWPLGDIDLVIEAYKNDNIDATDLLKLKEEGRKHACIVLPNKSKVPIVGYRINKWCSTCYCIWKYDIFPNENETIEEAILRSKINERCVKCNTKLMDFEEVVSKNIKCPFCKKDMNQARSFSNE